jgi:hypothetical protein
MHRAPMYTCFTCLRMTAYHSVVASRVPWIGNHGFGGRWPSGIVPLSLSWRRVAT